MSDSAFAPNVDAHADLEALFNGYHGWLVGRLFRRLGCHDTALDLAQDTFVKLMGRPVETLRQPKAFLSVVSNALAVDFFRRQAIERSVLESLARVQDGLEPSTEEIIQVVDILARISKALDNLSTRARSVFLLSRIDGLAYPAIAERIGVSLRTVENDMATSLIQCYRATYGDRAAAVPTRFR